MHSDLLVGSPMTRSKAKNWTQQDLRFEVEFWLMADALRDA